MTTTERLAQIARRVAFNDVVGRRTRDGDPRVTVDDLDRAANPGTPWTVTCAVCDLGVAFARSQETALAEAAEHLRAHRLSDGEPDGELPA